MSQPVPYQAPLLESGSNLISRPWYTFFDSISTSSVGGSSEQISWIPEQGPASPHGQEATFSGSIARSIGAKVGERISVADFGAVGDGLTDDSTAFNLAIQAATTKPGCDVYVPGGYRYLINGKISFPHGNTPITLSGDGAASVILCGHSPNAGVGFIDISSSDITIRDLLIDGQKTVPDKLKYNQDFQGVGGNDPLAQSLTTGTSIWVHSGVSRIIIDGVTIQHTQGYAILLNATEGADITDVDIRNCWFLNNRPSLFGITDGQLNYGSWNGGIMYHGDGRAGAPFMVRGLSVSNCHWRRCSGNAVWSHLYDFGSLHENIRICNNDFLDNGLDCIQFGGVCGGVCSANYARRVGYICSDDSETPGTPMWLNGAWASFLDTSGQVIGVDYTGNTAISLCGDGINLDGYSNGTVVGNTLRQPVKGEPEYFTDQVGSVGFAGATVADGPNYAHGMLSSNTSNDLPGGDSIVIVGNTILNFSDGAILLYAGRRCVIQSNNIEHPSNATEVPIVLGNVGTGDQQRTYDSAVYGNRIGWKPTTVRPCIREDASLAPFNPGDSNHIGVNTIIPVSGLAYGFESATSSSSRTEVRFDSNQPGLAFPSFYYMQSEGAADTSVLRWYYAENQNAPAIALQLQSRYGTGKIGTLFNVSNNGGAGTGVISTANRTNSNIPDSILTGHSYCDGFIVLTNSTYSDSDANTYSSNQWALIRYNPSLGYLEQSVAVSGGSRVWSQLGADQAAGPVNAVQYNGGSALAGNGNFVFDPVNTILYVTGYNGSGVIAHEFNSTASGGDHAVNAGGGAGFITGAGLAAFQSLVSANIYAGSANQDGSINTINGGSYAQTFNATATGSTAGVVVNQGAVEIYGSGIITGQQVVAHNIYAGSAAPGGGVTAIDGNCFAAVFNSPATGNNAALIVNQGAAEIFGNGNFQSQSVVAHNIYAGSAGAGGAISTIDGDCYANRFNSPATSGTQAITVNNGAFIVFGSGNFQGQQVLVNSIALPIEAAPAAQSGRAIIYADPSNQLMVSFNGGPFSALGSGGGGGTPSNTIVVQANGATLASVSTLNFTTNMGVSISGGTAYISSTASGGGGGGIAGVTTSDGASYQIVNNKAQLSFINSNGLINTSAASFGGTCNAGNYQISGNNGVTTTMYYTGTDGIVHSLTFLRGILIGAG